MNVRQIVFEDINKVVVRTADEPLQPGPSEVVLASAYLGICGSDLHVLQGKHPWTKPPVVTGHDQVVMASCLDMAAQGNVFAS